MKKLTKEETQHLVTGRGRISYLATTPFFQEVNSLEVGEGLEFSLEEWPLKSIFSVGFLYSACEDPQDREKRYSSRKISLNGDRVIVRIK